MAVTQKPRRRRRRKRHRFTIEECKRGYQAALQKCMEDWDLYAWFFHKLRKWYRSRR